MKIIADRSRCIGAGQCVVAAPDLFNQDDDDGLVVVMVAEIDRAQLSEVEFAVRSCPTQSLTLVDE